MKKHSEATQTLCAGCSKTDSQTHKQTGAITQPLLTAECYFYFHFLTTLFFQTSLEVRLDLWRSHKEPLVLSVQDINWLDALATHRFTDACSNINSQHTTQDQEHKKSSERRKHCALAVARRSQKFSPRRRPPSQGRGWPKFNQLEMVTTFTYRPSLVRINACNFELSW